MDFTARVSISAIKTLKASNISRIFVGSFAAFSFSSMALISTCISLNRSIAMPYNLAEARVSKINLPQTIQEEQR